METQPTAGTSPMPSASFSRVWDDYFPIINKAILGVVLVFGMIVASGVDVVQVCSKMFEGEAMSASAVPRPEMVVESTPMTFSFSITGPGGWKNAIVLVAVIFGITVVALSFLSASGRDAARMKEQEAMLKESSRPALPVVAAAAAAPTAPAKQLEPEECNLSSFKLFYRSAEEPAAVGAEKAAV